MEFFESIQNLLESFGVTDSLITLILGIIGYVIIYIRTGSKYLTKKLNLNNMTTKADLSSYEVYYKGKLISYTDLTFKKKEV